MQPINQYELETPLTKSSDFVLSLYNNKALETSKFSSLPHRALGEWGEQLAKRKFEQAGYVVKNAPLHSKCGDLRVFCKGQATRKSRIEIKTAQGGKSGKFRFCLSKGKHTNHCHSDYVLLIAIDRFDNEFLYLIPTFAIADIKYISITKPRTYSGRFARYRVHGQLSLTASLEIALL